MNLFEKAQAVEGLFVELEEISFSFLRNVGFV
jgi:hypothetical protein